MSDFKKLSKIVSLLDIPVTTNVGQKEINEYLSNGSSHSITADFSGGNIDDFVYTAVSDSTLLSRVIFILSDQGMFNTGCFAALPDPLAVGLKFFIQPAGKSKLYINLVVPITTNANFSTLMYDVRHNSFGTGNGNDYLTGRWTFTKAFGNPIWLNVGDKFGVEVNDDLSLVDEFIFNLQGYQNI